MSSYALAPQDGDKEEIIALKHVVNELEGIKELLRSTYCEFHPENIEAVQKDVIARLGILAALS